MPTAKEQREHIVRMMNRCRSKMWRYEQESALAAENGDYIESHYLSRLAGWFSDNADTWERQLDAFDQNKKLD